MKNNINLILIITILGLVNACAWSSPTNPKARSDAPQRIEPVNTSVRLNQTRSETVDPDYSVQNFDANLLRTVVERQIGRPYLYGGNTPQGFDCSGLVQYSFKQMGAKLPRSTLDQMQQLRPVAKADLRGGDLVFFRTGHKQLHVAIMTDTMNFVHAPSSGKTVMRGRLDSPYWQQNFIGARRY